MKVEPSVVRSEPTYIIVQAEALPIPIAVTAATVIAQTISFFLRFMSIFPFGEYLFIDSA